MLRDLGCHRGVDEDQILTDVTPRLGRGFLCLSKDCIVFIFCVKQYNENSNTLDVRVVSRVSVSQFVCPDIKPHLGPMTRCGCRCETSCSCARVCLLSVVIDFTWLHGYMVAWLHGHMVAWLHVYVVAWLHGHMIAWLHGYMVAWLYVYMVAWLHSCMVTVFSRATYLQN